MGHAIRAFILPQALASVAVAEVPGARTVMLPQGLCLLPVTDDIFDGLRARYPEVPDPPSECFWYLSGPVIRAAESISQHGAIAYIETEYFGGSGSQAATVWDRGEQSLAPEKRARGPINRALRLLGVRAAALKDEFDTIQLGNERSNEGWLGDDDA
jgi:hypothetical protein